ncbi:tigger transposable element-derived protein 6-like [Dermacentor albipictus]|uniref:tigger transposable element-derived protein 6-like n=1 Tax=Dermacentor albipictus TaxID=60249 RepID=UPI0031FDBC86
MAKDIPIRGEEAKEIVSLMGRRVWSDHFVQHANKCGLKQKTAKEGQHEKLEKVLVKWLYQAWSSAINVDSAILKEKVDLVALRVGIDNFQASNGCYGDKRSKERGTALFCASEDGFERLPVLVVGKFVKPRCFENLKMLPCSYNFSKKARMTSSLFSSFLQQLDNKMVLSRLQPLDAGIIKCVKQGYQKQLVQRQLAPIKCSESEKKITVLDAMHFIASLWNAALQSAIANSFKHCGFKRETASSAGDATTSMPLEANAGFTNDDFEGLNLTTTFAEYVEANDNIAICGDTSLDVPIKETLPSADPAVTSDEDEDDTTDAVPEPTTFAEELWHIDGIRNFIYSRDAAEDFLLDVVQLE